MKHLQNTKCGGALYEAPAATTTDIVPTSMLCTSGDDNWESMTEDFGNEENYSIF